MSEHLDLDSMRFVWTTTSRAHLPGCPFLRPGAHQSGSVLDAAMQGRLPCTRCLPDDYDRIVDRVVDLLVVALSRAPVDVGALDEYDWRSVHIEAAACRRRAVDSALSSRASGQHQATVGPGAANLARGRERVTA